MQQAIRLLQLSSMELELEVQQALDSNLMLELEEEDRDPLEYAGEGAATSSASGDEDYDSGVFGAEDSVDHDELPAAPEHIPTDLPVDSDWEDVFDSTVGAAGSGSAPDEDRQEIGRAHV